MNPRKPVSRKSKSAGISLEPDLIKRSKDFAESNGFGSLSNWVRFLLTQELSRADGRVSYTLAETPGSVALKRHKGVEGRAEEATGDCSPGTKSHVYPKGRRRG